MESEQKRKKHKITYIERVLNIWGIALILWSLYRYVFKTDLPIWFDELLAKPLFFLLPIYLFVKNYEKKPFWKSVGLRSKGFFVDALIGVAIGSVFFIIGLSSKAVRPHLSPNTLILAVIAFATALSEEILSTGFVLSRLYSESKQLFTSILYSAVLFFLIHVPILFTDPSLKGALLIRTMLVNIVLSIVVSCAYFLRRESLIVAITIHALYAFSLVMFMM
jgi:membrane protease YdiL (CAAX protease family)